VESPKQLAGLDADELCRRVEAFAATSTGQVLLHAGNRYELSRLTNWIRAARRLDGPRIQQYDRQDRISSGNGKGSRRSPAGPQEAKDGRERRLRRPRRPLAGQHNSGGTHEAASADREPSRRRDRASRADVAASSSRDAVVLKLDEDSSEMRFYLNLADPIEAAPSIGPQTAERLERIGVHTVADFLHADAETVAQRLNHRYLNADTIRQWQQQTILVCRVPQLRGHDAQILVACGVTDPETLASTDPATLWKKVEPFSQSAEGKRIIRGGKMPDFEEVYRWIAWAGHARQLRAA
jgi:hypothetical protein